MTSSLKQIFFRILKKTDEHEGILILLCVHILLRIQNLFEPYWYGDEAIYLSLGQALRNGLVLYKEIIDHKTPLIYYFAMLAGNQFGFRIILMAWMSGTIWFLFSALKNLDFSKYQRNIATAVFIIFTTLPWLEGNIPNGELFVMGFIIMAFWFLSRLEYIQEVFSFDSERNRTLKTLTFNQKNVKLLVYAGLFCSLAVLTKVPAIFDVGGLLITGLIIFWLHKKVSKQSIIILLKTYGLFGIAFLSPIGLSFVYYFLRGAGQEYIDIALLYNFKYAGNWALPFSQPLLVWLFSLKGRVLILIGTIVVSFLFRQKIKPLHQWLTIWLIASMVGATLSLRPYPHYFLQLIPPLSILVGSVFTKKMLQLKKESFITLTLILLTISVWKLLEFQPYDPVKYYGDFLNLTTGKITREQYENSFNSYVADNKIVTTILDQSDEKRIFIWGTNPMLYAQSEKIPVGRFTVAFHIADFPGAFSETMSALTQHNPEFIVVMKNESIKFPEFYGMLAQSYVEYKELEHMTVYRRINLKSTELNTIISPSK